MGVQVFHTTVLAVKVTKLVYFEWKVEIGSIVHIYMELFSKYAYN